MRLQTPFLCEPYGWTHLREEGIHLKRWPSRPFVVWLQGTREEEEEEERRLSSRGISIRFREVNSTLLARTSFTDRHVYRAESCRASLEALARFRGVCCVPQEKCGAAPSLQTTRFNEAGTLCGGGRGFESGHAHPLRSTRPLSLLQRSLMGLQEAHVWRLNWIMWECYIYFLRQSATHVFCFCFCFLIFATGSFFFNAQWR